MPVAKITGQGLCAIACSVALLWACLVGEQMIVRHAALERVKVLREIEQLQRRPRHTPVRTPLPAVSRHLLVSAG